MRGINFIILSFFIANILHSMDFSFEQQEKINQMRYDVCMLLKKNKEKASLLYAQKDCSDEDFHKEQRQFFFELNEKLIGGMHIPYQELLKINQRLQKTLLMLKDLAEMFDKQYDIVK